MCKKICVVGGGSWGKNHIRTLFQLGHLGGIVESDPRRLQELRTQYSVSGFTTIEDSFAEGYNGYVVATPAETHYLLGKELLDKGFNLLIEKPLALSSVHSAELVSIAERKKVNLMVGHVLLFHPAIRKIKELIDQGMIGDLYYVYSNRLNLGTVRTEESVFWSLAPHDLSVLDYLIGDHAIGIEAKGTKFLQEKVYDFTLAQLTYPGNVHAHILVSWLHPFKEQRLVVVGSKGMLSFEDSSAEREIIYYHKRIQWVNGIPVKKEEPDEVVDYEGKMPLEEELRYFIDHLDNKVEIANGQSGHEVVNVLETVQDILDRNERGDG